MTLNYNSLNNRFGLTFGANYSTDGNEGVARIGGGADLAAVAYSFPINFPLHNPDGSLYWTNPSNSLYVNPLSYQNRRYKGINSHLLGNVGLRYTLFDGFNVKIDGSFNKQQFTQEDLAYSKSFNPFTAAKPSATYQQNYTQTWNVEPTAEYVRQIDKGKLTVLAGTTFQGNQFVQPYYITASNYSSDALLKSYSFAGSYTINSYVSEYKYNSVFGRLNYNWMSKYILNLNYRWDASSRFGENNRTGSFASAGGAWIFSEENFMKNHVPFISFGKIRASYGHSGNDQIGNNRYFDNYSASPYQYEGVASLVPSNLSNPNLHWEINKKMEAALELNFFNNRIAFSGAWFRNRTSNPLVSSPVSTVTGFATYLDNMNATVQTIGTEFTLNTENVKSDHFNWNTYFNISFPKSKLVAFPGIENTSYVSSRIVGSSLSDIYGYHYTGIEKSTGLPAVADANNDGVATDQDPALAYYGKGDYVKIGNYDPDFYGGLSNSFEYKGFQLDVMFQFVGRRMIKGIGSYDYSPYAPGYLAANMYQGAYDLFKATDGKIANVAYNSSPNGNLNRYYLYANSDAIISNAAYIRLKNVALSYTFPRKMISRLKMQNATLFANAQNLLTITKFAGNDPETQPNNIPPMQTIVFGLRCTL